MSDISQAITSVSQCNNNAKHGDIA